MDKLRIRYSFFVFTELRRIVNNRNYGFQTEYVPRLGTLHQETK